MANLTAPIPGEVDSYIVELDVFHEIHCLVVSFLLSRVAATDRIRL